MQTAIRLREIRESAGLTQAELAELADTSQSTVSLIERGGETTTRALRQLAAALDVDLSELFAARS